MKLKLADIIDLNGKILDYANLIKKIPLKVTVLDYYGLRRPYQNKRRVPVNGHCVS